jgi:hypothetical protein
MSAPERLRPNRHDWRLTFLLGLGFTIFYTGFTHGSFKGSDEVGVFQVTEALYLDGSLAVPIHHHAHLGADGRLYHAWATGQSVLALPFYALSRVAESTLPTAWSRALAGPKGQSSRRLRAERVDELRRAGLDIRRQTLRYGGSIEIFFVGLYAPVMSGVLLAVFFTLLRELGASTRSALTAAALTGLSSYPAMMSLYFLRHTTETVATLVAFALFHAYRRSGRLPLLALGSLAASSTFLVRFPAVLSGLGFGLYVGWCLWERVRAGAPRMPLALAVAGPLLLASAVHVSLEQRKWGNLFDSPMLAAGLESSASFWTPLSAFLWSPGISVFAYSPLLLLLPWTFASLWRTRRPECIAFATVALTELLYFSGYRFWTGLYSAPGPRYLFPGCVLLMLPLGVWLDGPRTRLQRLALWGLAAVGGGIQLALLTASWRGVVRGERYADYDPPFSFLFDPAASPIAASARVALDGNLDAWLWKLAFGWPGQDAQPAVAAALALLWITACAAMLRWIRRTARRLE